MKGSYNMSTFKGRVKTLNINNEIYQVSFDYSDKIKIGKDEYGVAYELNEETLNISSINTDEEFSTSKEIFDFLSQHSLEEIEVTYDKKEINGVKLRYE